MSVNKKLLRGALSAIFVFSFLLGLSININPAQYEVFDGLSQNTVNCMKQDPFGFLWIGTNDGLNRFDGYKFKTYRISEIDTISFKNNKINDLLIDDDSLLWVGAEGGLYSFDPNTEKLNAFRFRATESNQRGERLALIDIEKMNNERLLFCSNNGLFSLDKNTGTIDKLLDSNSELENGEQFLSIYSDSKNIIWVGTSFGVYCYNIADNKLIKKPFELAISKREIKDIIESANGEMLFATPQGVYAYNEKDNLVLHHSKILSNEVVDVNSFAIDGQGNLIIGTELRGVIYYNRSLNRIIEKIDAGNHLSTNLINTLLVDRLGMLWIGTIDKGVYAVNLKEQFIKLVADNDKSLKYVTAIEKANFSSIWIGTRNNGIFRMSIDRSGETELFDYEDLPVQLDYVERNAINDLLLVNGKLYVATGELGIYEIQLEGTRWGNIQHFTTMKRRGQVFENINYLTYDGVAHIWLVNNGKDLYSFNINNHSFKQIPVDLIDNITALEFDATGKLWVGTETKGVYWIADTSGDTISMTRLETPYFDNVAVSCFHFKEDAVYIGTAGYGFIRYSKPDKSFTRFSSDNGLINQIVHGISSDKAGNIWVSTNWGISKLNSETKTFDNYTGRTYLQALEFNKNVVYRDAKGMIYFAGNDGINYLDPNDQTSVSGEPYANITSLLVNNREVKPQTDYDGHVILEKSILNTKTIDLFYEQKVVSFEIAPIHFSDPRNNLFRYKLENFDPDWVLRDVSNRFVTYNDLPGGSYTFKVQAANSEGLWSENVREVEVNVYPPFWQTNTFKVLLFGGLLFVVIVFFMVWSYNQKRRRRLIEDEKFLLQSLIDNIPDSIYFKDLHSKFTRINKAQARLLNIKDPAEAIGKSDLDFFDHSTKTLKDEMEIIRTGKPLINDVHKFTNSFTGNVQYLADTKIALRDRKNNIIGTVGITKDITDLRNIEEMVKENEAKYKSLFNNAPLAIFRLTEEGNIVECNPRFLNMFGLESVDESTGKQFDGFIADDEINITVIRGLIENQELNTEIVLKRIDGEVFYANLVMSLVEGLRGDKRIEGTVADITDNVRTREEMLIALEKAEEADRLKSAFLANLSHEIRTPMNAILGFSNMLREDCFTHEERVQFIDIVSSNGTDLLNLIDDIIDFSKIESNQLAISLTRFELNSLMNSTHKAFKLALFAREKSHLEFELIKGIDEDLHMHSDMQRLKQILNNLINNAIKFTDQGKIEFGYELNPDETVTIFVNDTGIGIPEEKQEVIFDRFVKINDDKDRLYGGTGIGLTITKELVNLLKGSLVLESEVGEGTHFRITLPINV